MKHPKPTARIKDPDYLAWIAGLPCLITKRHGVECAHLSTGDAFYGHEGRALRTKAHDRWCLPLSPEEHKTQHTMNELDYWRSKNINPYFIACVLWGIYCDHKGQDNDGTKAATFVCDNARAVCLGGLR